ncbi:CDP-glycerol glycerophosphotransferase family protein, partial [Heyndrickxia sporothermodurans]|uniref:CDP-glycerol glycerophosphotransferase family protein n=1 Tax=Heyndrickxia sporothermodurans TaxID=46224 RepID=UPI00362D4963
MGASKLFNKAKKAVQFSLKFFHKIVDKNFYRSIKYTSYYKKTKIDDRVIFYESFQGKSMIDSPYAIFKRLINDTNYKDYKHVWALNSRDNLYAQIYKGHKNVEFVKVHSDKYLKYLTAAKYLINNDAFPSYFQKKENQVYINTWHGTLSEAISKDLKEERGQLRNIQRNFLHTDYILNPNKRIANRLVESYGLEGIYAGNVVVEGYPRTDLTLSSNKEEIKEILTKSLNVDFNQKIILYAPTWKEETNNVEDISDKINELHSNIPIEYQLILKVHASLYERLKVNDSLREICIPEWIDTNELLSVVDILICDYSGIFYDFLITNRPIIFYLDNHEVCHSPDESSQDLKELPGPICTEINEVINEIADVKYYMDFYKNRREKMISAFCPYDDGNVTDRNIDIIFKSKHTKNVYPIKNDKKTILMYCGGFLNNGITTSAINLLNNLDYTKFNVVIVEKEKYDPVSTQNLKNLNHHVKKIYRIGSMNLTIREWLLHNFIVRKGLRNEKLHKHIPKQSYRRELLRLFGNVKFDIAIDFSGYVPFWSMLFAFSEFERKNIYQHNDMLSEYNKIINNKYKHRSNMNIIFPLYKYFDKVVSVAKNTRDLNVKNLPKFLPREKAVYVHNCIDANKILRQKNEEEIIINEQRDVASMNDLNDQEKLYKNRIIAPVENNINL